MVIVAGFSFGQNPVFYFYFCMYDLWKFNAIYLQGAFGKNALIAFGLTTYTLLGLGVVCPTFTTFI